MLRLFTILSLFFLNLYACKGGYTSCVQKAKDAKVFQKNALYIPVKKGKILVYSRNTPNAKILKYDPFLSLYLLKERSHFSYPYDINMRLQLGTALLHVKQVKEGKIVTAQVGFDTFARYSQKVNVPALISSSCCSLEGLLCSKGIIQKEYLQHFVQTKNTLYGDIGIRVKNEKHDVIVYASDPFIKHNPFKRDDCIVAFDNKKVKNASSLMQKILFSRVGSKHMLTIKRGSKFLRLKVVSAQRFGGGYLSDTFLERKGIYFDKNLHIMAINKTFQDYGLKIGDKLIQVNSVRVKNQKELRRYIENFKNYSSLLFERNKFQFFVNIK